jgi:hypothetical protein
MCCSAKAISAVTEEALGKHPGLRIELKYFEGQPAIKHVARVSKPGRRVYSGSKELPVVRNGLGITIVSTPRAFSPTRKRASRMSAAKCWRRCSDEPHRQKPGDDPGGRDRVRIEGGVVLVKGPKGTLSIPMADEVTYTLEDGKLTVAPANATSAPAPSGVCSARWCRTSSRA